MTLPESLIAYPVRALTWLPYGLRPGFFLALLFAGVWLLVRPRGAARFAHLFVRLLATLVDLVTGVMLLPDYVVATHRRRRGVRPGQVSLAIAPVLERGLDWAAALYERHQPGEHPPTRVPLTPCLLLVALPLGAWLLADQAPDSAAAERVTRAFEYWDDLEGWAEAGGDDHQAGVSP